VTQTHETLGSDIDFCPDEQVTDLDGLRSTVLLREQAAIQQEEDDLVEALSWERGIIDLNAPAEGHYSLFRNAEYEKYAEFYKFSPGTLIYARDRAAETSNPLLRVHHLEFVLARGPQRGRESINTQRELAKAYRTLVDHTTAMLTGQPDDHSALYISRWVERIAALIGTRGVSRGGEPAEWAEWILEVAEKVRAVDWQVDSDIEMLHRWPYEILEHLVAVPPEAVSEKVRARTLILVSEAFEHYSSQPLADHFTSRLAEVEASLRKQFGEKNTHETMIRRQYDAAIQAAHFHREHGSGLVAQHFFRDARKLVESQRQYFTQQDVEELQRLERQSLEAAQEGGEFKVVSADPVEIRLDNYDRRQGAAGDTMKLLVALRDARIPSYVGVVQAAADTMRAHPIQFLFGAATVDRGKVVSEASTEEQHLKREIQQQIGLTAQFVGLELHVTLVRAFENGELNATDVVKELGLLGLDPDEMEILERGIDRFLAEDFISAGHILSAQFENALRRKLTQVGVEPTRFRTLPDGTTRTDEATLGDLMHSATRDGRTVRELLGADAWNFIDRTMVAVNGWNLRNKYAHGLAGKSECVGAVVGVILHHIFWLATLDVVAVPEGHADPASATDQSDPVTDDTAQ
jgi:hypothetical protein